MRSMDLHDQMRSMDLHDHPAPPPRRRVTWQHEETGYIFTKEIPAGEPTPDFPRRFVVSEEPI